MWNKDTGFPQTKASARVFYWLNLIRSQFANSLQGSAPGNTKQSRESGSRKKSGSLKANMQMHTAKRSKILWMILFE